MLVGEMDEYKAGLEKKADGKSAREPRKALRPDLGSFDLPRSPGEFRQAWHQPPICQSLTGQCWSFASTSFLESEVHRITGRQVRLSEAWTFYWEFVEKARRFIRHKGDSYFTRGSEPNASLHVWRQYGVVPAEAYSGLPGGKTFLDDRKMYAELSSYLNALKTTGKWDESAAISKVRSILDRHLGRPPETVEFEKSRMTPRQYLETILPGGVSEYVSVLSLVQHPWDDWCTFESSDNWWKSRQYYNVPADDFVKVIRSSIQNGGTVCLVTDNSEPGFYYREDVAVVPSFDIPGSYIDDAARQMRFANESTSDDHVVHIVGLQQRGDTDWYLVKDSDTKPRNGHHGGYMFYHQDYIKLKALAAMLPRAAVERTLGHDLGAAPEDERVREAAASQPSQTEQ